MCPSEDVLFDYILSEEPLEEGACKLLMKIHTPGANLSDSAEQ